MMRQGNKPQLGRHRRNCSICSHLEKDAIESDFISWHSPAVIAKQYGLADRASVYRHAHAFSLFEKRRRNVRAALEMIIERAGDIEVTGSAVVAAIQAYAKINAAGEWIEPTEQVSMRDLYDRMTAQELEEYARTGRLPEWFKAFTADEHEDE